MKDSGAVIINKFKKNGEDFDPFKAFRGEIFHEAHKDLSSEESFQLIFDHYAKVMDKKGYEFAGSFQEEGKKMIFVPKEFGAKRFIKEAYGVDVDKVNSLPKIYRDEIMGEQGLAKRAKL